MRDTSTPDTCDVVLKDGSTVQLRPVVGRDAEGIASLCARLSPQSVYFRFFNARGYDRSAIDRLLGADGDNEYVVVAEWQGQIVAFAQYARDHQDPTRAEAAFLVDDTMQGRGIGTRLLEALADHARAHGIGAIWASVLAGNDRMLGVFLDSGFAVEHKTEQGVVGMVLSLDETATFEEKHATRASHAARASLRAFFEPESVAVVGAGRDGGVGAAVLNNLRATGFRGRIVPIHPTAERVQGLLAYPRLTAVPGRLDLVVVVVPAASVLDVVRDAVTKHIPAIVVISAGFAESGPEGRARQTELLDIVRTAGVRLIGPNCMGLLNADPRVQLNATFSPVFPPPGHVAFSTQSGALGLAILEYARRVNLGISTFASIGNKADVSSNDLIQYWADDPNTKVILLYLESFGNPRKFGQITRAVGARKPIVAVKAGRSVAGARAASSHTGALAASDRIVDALFRHSGVIRTTTLEEMFDVAMLLDRQPLPAGPGVAILTNAGGPGILAADACDGRGLAISALLDRTIDQLREFLPAAASLQNPVDMLATASAADYGRAMRILLADPHVDSLLTIFIPPLVTAAADVAAAMTQAARDSSKPVLATFIGVDDAVRMLAPIPSYRFPEAAIGALARAVEYCAWRSKPAGHTHDYRVQTAAASAIVAGALTRGTGWMTPDEAQRVIAAMGIDVVPTRHAATADEAVACARDLGYPVALKGHGPAILHKSDMGAVRLNLSDDAAVREAFTQLSDSLGAQLSGVIVQRMVSGGVEMFVGGLQDQTFGPVIFCGSGGVLVELFGDVACRLCPVTDRDAAEMLNEIRGVLRLRGYRGQPPVDEASFRDALMRVAALIAACPQIQELDLNPLTVLTAGVAALDVRIRVGPPAGRSTARRVRY